MYGCHIQPEQMFNLIFGYNGTYIDQKSNLNASEGPNWLYGNVVPVGEVWVITVMRGINLNRTTEILLGSYDGTTISAVQDCVQPSTSASVVWSGMMVLPAGYRTIAGFVSCQAGDDIYFDIHGYKMKVSQ